VRLRSLTSANEANTVSFADGLACADVPRVHATSTAPHGAWRRASPFWIVAVGWVKARGSGRTGPLRNMNPNTSPLVRADDPPSSAKRQNATSTAPCRAQYGRAWPARSPGQSGSHSIGGPEANALGRTEQPPPNSPATTAEATASGPVPVGAGSRPVVPAAVWLPGAGGPPPPRPAPPAGFPVSVCGEPSIEKRFLLLWTVGVPFGILASWSRCFAVRVRLDFTLTTPNHTEAARPVSNPEVLPQPPGLPPIRHATPAVPRPSAKEAVLPG